MKKILLLLLIASAVCAETPKNIILFIGDGMGPAQVTAAKVIKGTLEMERCPVTGLMTTWAADKLITDSAAAATAMATGVKTKNGMISIGPDGNRLKTVLERAEEKGKTTGLVATCAVTHATPAGFATHVPNRNQHEEIARQLTESDVDVLFGGGLKHFRPDLGPDHLPKLREKMTVATNTAEFRALGTPKKAAALLYPVHPPLAAEREIPLTELTTKAIEILSQDEDGFFLMVEGSQIDWMGHDNNGTDLVAEVVDFDDVIKVGLDFAESDGDTLVIITADHETGAFALLDGSLAEKTVTKTGFASDYHSACIVPLFATGPSAKLFGGMQDNTDLAKKIFRLIEVAE